MGPALRGATVKLFGSDALGIINILRNLAPGTGGYLPMEQLKALYEDNPKLLRNALRELNAHGAIKFNDKGDIALTEAGARLQ